MLPEGPATPSQEGRFISRTLELLGCWGLKLGHKGPTIQPLASLSTVPIDSLVLQLVAIFWETVGPLRLGLAGRSSL